MSISISIHANGLGDARKLLMSCDAPSYNNANCVNLEFNTYDEQAYRVDVYNLSNEQAYLLHAVGTLGKGKLEELAKAAETMLEEQKGAI